MTEPQYRGRAWQTVRRAVLERDGYRCQLCGAVLDPNGRKGSATAPVVDHITAVSAGGAWHDPANLRASCVACNSARANRARRRRYPLPRAW